MSEARHTPGPWKAVPNGGDDDDPRALLVGRDDQYGDFTTIADCRGRWITEEIGGDIEANARLIAAAPAMYEALQHAEGAVEQLCIDQHPDNACWETLRMIRAALSLAESK